MTLAEARALKVGDRVMWNRKDSGTVHAIGKGWVAIDLHDGTYADVDLSTGRNLPRLSRAPEVQP